MRRVLILVLLFLMTLSQSYAFWSSGIQAASSIETVAIQIGYFDYIPEWEPNPEQTYEEGDVVFWEGEYYVRNHRAPNLNWEPGGFLGWILWDQQ
jgi:hypothetical protein